MTIQDFEQMLRDSGVDDASIKSLIANDKVQSKATSLRHQSEYQALESDYGEAKIYADWYKKNEAKLLQLFEAEKARLAQGEQQQQEQQNQQNQQQTAMSRADIEKLINERATELYQKTYAPQIVGLTTGIGTVVEQHMRRGRKDKIDWKKLDELAAKTHGDISQAYEEYDRPNLEKDHEAAFNARVEKEVKEKLAAAGVNRFPAGADAQPSNSSPLSARANPGEKTYDRSKVLETFLSGEYTRQ